MSDQVLVWLLLEQSGSALLMRRKQDRRPFAGLWTLPGDRLGEDESASELVSRFARDELDVQVRDEEFVDTFFLREDDTEYAVNVFRPRYEGKPRYRESGPFDDARWLTPPQARELAGTPTALVELLEGKRHWQEPQAEERGE